MRDKINEAAFAVKNGLFRGKAVKKYRELLCNQQLTTQSLAALNWEKRKRIVTVAYESTNLYRTYYDACGFHPSMLAGEKDWAKVPVLEREMIRENSERMVARGVARSRLAVSTTGGSTGQPLKVYQDRNFPKETVTWRFIKWWGGVTVATDHATVHRRVPTSAKAILKDSLLWFPTRRVFLNASSFTEEDIAGFIEKLRRKKIKRITGYVGALEKVSEYILKNELTVTGIQHIWTTSAPLSLSARSKIEKAFGTKVMDQYGSCEVYSIAQQCPHCEGLHINSDVVHVDVVGPDNGPAAEGVHGDLLVTDLENMAFPLIKYRIGDRSRMVAAQSTECELPFPLMDFVAGRVSDCIATPSGITLTGDYLTTIFDDHVENVLAFQVCQKKDFSLVIRVVPNPKAKGNSVAFENVRRAVEEKLRCEVPVSIELTESIGDDKGKTRYIIKEN